MASETQSERQAREDRERQARYSREAQAAAEEKRQRRGVERTPMAAAGPLPFSWPKKGDGKSRAARKLQYELDRRAGKRTKTRDKPPPPPVAQAEPPHRDQGK